MVKRRKEKDNDMINSEKLWDGLILINLFMAVFIYLPIFVPMEAYIKVQSLIFFIGFSNLMILGLALQWKSFAKSQRVAEEGRGKVVSFYRNRA